MANEWVVMKAGAKVGRMAGLKVAMTADWSAGAMVAHLVVKWVA